MGTDYVIAFQGQRTIYHHISLTCASSFSIDAVVTGSSVGAGFFHNNFAAGSIGNLGCMPSLGHDVLAHSIGAAHINCAGISDLCSPRVLRLNTDILLRLTACYRGIAQYINDAVRTQINRSRGIAVTCPNSGCTLGFLTDGNSAIVIYGSIVASHQDTNLIGGVAD